MERLHAKLGIKPPDEDEAPAPDYSPWFEPIPLQRPTTADGGGATGRIEPSPKESWWEAFVAIIVYSKRIAKGAVSTIWLLAALILGASGDAETVDVTLPRRVPQTVHREM
jgi:hypothetical protein